MDMKRSSLFLFFFIAALSPVLFSSCTGGDKTRYQVIFFPHHMDQSSVLKAQRGTRDLPSGTSMRTPPKHTIPIGFKPYPYKNEKEAAGQKNPLVLSAPVLERGGRLYQVYCNVCHGGLGLGDGPVVPPYPIPKSLQSNDVLSLTDGAIFHVITQGKGAMPAYASQIRSEDRWAIVHYVRALQRAYNPTKEDIESLKEEKKKFE